MPLIDIFRQQPELFSTFVVLFGLLVGSFLNVVIYRLPLMMEQEWQQQCADLNNQETKAGTVLTLSRPGSRCPHCNHEITAIENIPILSYVFLKGKCKDCGTKISARYPIVELITGLMSGVIACQFGFGWPCLGALLLTWALISLTYIDFDHQLLPDKITLPLLWLGLIFNLFSSYTDLQSSVIGAIAGYLTLWIVYHGFKLATGKEGMGFGDFKLLAALGAWLGWQYLPMIVLLSSLVGAVVGISLILLRQHHRDIPIPFGPYLAAAGWLALTWGTDINQAYLHWIGLN